jgi:hypothetical protein
MLVPVPGMRHFGKGQRIDCIHFLLSGRRIRGIDAYIALSTFLHQYLRFHTICLILDYVEISSELPFFSLTIFK